MPERMPTTTRPTRARTIAGLLAMGYKDFSPPERKYRSFHRIGQPRHYLVGKSGGLRLVLSGQQLADSLSITGGKEHRALSEVGDPCFRFRSSEEARQVFFRLTNVQA
jgi:hypothetical protein